MKPSDKPLMNSFIPFQMFPLKLLPTVKCVKKLWTNWIKMMSCETAAIRNLADM